MNETMNQPSYDEGSILYINEGHELELLGKQLVSDPKQLMYPAFRAAMDALKGIVDSSKNWNERNRRNRRGTAHCNSVHGLNSENEELYTYSNNIIAFCGARGQGKTSAMLSFSHALSIYRSGNDSNGVYYPREEDSMESFHHADLEDACFYVLPPIDPTMLGEKDLVLELILARLLDVISSKWRNTGGMAPPHAGNSQDEHNKHEVLKRFNVCMEGLHSDRKEEATGTEKLARAKDAFRVKSELREIILYFLCLLGFDPENSYLVVQLDDTDMQFNRAYDILEEVRKYLSLPNVIVLMATDLEQIRYLISLHYSKVLEKAPDDCEVSRLSTKYLDKLIPASHAIHLPTVKGRSEKNRQLYIRVHAENGQSKTTRDRYSSFTKYEQQSCTPPVNKEDNSLERFLFKLIYEKTGLVFIEHESYLHDIIPLTLRGVVQLYRMLSRMPSPRSFDEMRCILERNDQETKDEAKETFVEYLRVRSESNQIKLNNLRLFEDYFLGDWVPSKLMPKHQNIVREIEKTLGNRRIEVAINSLQQHAQPTDPQSPYSYIRFLQISEKMDKNTDDDYRFVFALRTYFSILLNEAALMDELSPFEIFITPVMEHDDSGSGYNIQYTSLLEMLTGTSTSVEQQIPFNSNNARIDTALTKSFAKLFNTCIKVPNNSSVNKANLTNDIWGILSSFIQTIQINNHAPKLPPSQGISNLWRMYSYVIDSLLYICCNWDVQHQFFNVFFQNLENISEEGRIRARGRVKAFSSPEAVAKEKENLLWQFFKASMGKDLNDLANEKYISGRIKNKKAVGMFDDYITNPHDLRNREKKMFPNVLSDLSIQLAMSVASPKYPKEDTK